MSTNFQGINWLNLNAQRAYPLSEQATGTDISGSITLPYSFIVALQLPVRSALGINPQNFFLQSVILTSTGYTITVGYTDGTTIVSAATVSIATATHAENDCYELIGIGSFSDSVGSVCVGNLDDINALPPGQYLFDINGGKLDPDAIRPQIRQLSSLTLINGTESSGKIYGDITLNARHKHQFCRVLASGMPTQITINAISGAGPEPKLLLRRCPLPRHQFSQSTVFRATRTAIFGLPAKIVSTSTTEPNGLLLTNNCASPCCG